MSNFLDEMDNPSAGINAFTSLYHLHEWLWRYNLKPMIPSAVRGKILRRREDFRDWLNLHCPHFQLLEELTNGAKHASPVHNGGPVAGYGQGPFGIGPFGRAYLLIDLGDDAGTERYLSANRVLSEAGSFMIGLSKELGA